LFCGFAVGAWGEHFGGEGCGEVGDFVEVAVFWVEVLAGFAELAAEGGAGGGEEGFPVLSFRA